MVITVKAKTLWAMGRRCLPEMMYKFDAFLMVLHAVRQGRLDPGFDPRSYGHASLSSLVNALKDQLETRREEKGNTVMLRFRG